MLWNLRKKQPILWLTVCALLMAMNIVMSMSVLSLPVPGGHLYFNDVIIDTAALMLDPLGAFLVGGVGALLGDAFFYPAPMFVSLITHGLQAVAISLCSHLVTERRKKTKAVADTIGVTLGVVILCVGYTIGRTYFYGAKSWQVAMVKLPYEFLQGLIGAVVSMVLIHGVHLDERLLRVTRT